MKWQMKSAALRALDALPFGDELHYRLQRNVTRSLPRPTREVLDAIADCRRHVASFRKHGVEGGLLLSYGAGWDLLENLVYYRYGIDRQIAIDIKPLARIELVDAVAAMLGDLMTEGDPDRRFVPVGSDLAAGLAQGYGIEYRAPADARAVDLPDASVDMIATTNTLEHIPIDSLLDIMKEGRRLLSPRGVVSMLIDYSDHFAHSDSSITVYNFLRFDAATWRRHNTGRHFQSRLRHSDYARLFRDAGFRILAQEAERPRDWEKLVERQPISSEFRGYEIDDLATVHGYFLLAPGVPDQAPRA